VYESGNAPQVEAWNLSLDASLAEASHGPYDSRRRVGNHGNPAFVWVAFAGDEASCYVLDVVFGFAMKMVDGLASYHDERCVAMSLAAIPPLQAPNGSR
jgi:hypothetical protein